jgi:hypothetical protein
MKNKFLIYSALVLLIAGIIGVCAPTSAANEQVPWDMFHFDSQRTGNDTAPVASAGTSLLQIDLAPIWYYHPDIKIETTDATNETPPPAFAPGNAYTYTGTWTTTSVGTGSSSYGNSYQFTTVSNNSATATATGTWTFAFLDTADWDKQSALRTDQTQPGWASFYNVYIWVPVIGNSNILPWTPSTPYSVGDEVITTNTVTNNHIYRCYTAGTSGTADNTANWPTDGSTVTDGSVTWQDIGTNAQQTNVQSIPDAHYTVTVTHSAPDPTTGIIPSPDVYYPDPVDQTSGGRWTQLSLPDLLTGFQDWQPDTNYNVGDEVFPGVDSSNPAYNHLYQCTQAGESGDTNPGSGWPIDGSSIQDGTVTWEDMGVTRTSIVVRQGDVLTVTLSNLSQYTDSAHIVFADGCKLERDAAVEGSPVASLGDSPVLSADNRLLSSVTETLAPSSSYEEGIYDSLTAGGFPPSKTTIYSIATESTSGLGLTSSDDRGKKRWQFPADPGSWISGIQSSTPTVFDLGQNVSCPPTYYSPLGGSANAGRECAAFASADGMVYVIDTQHGNLIWQGPGWVADTDDNIDAPAAYLSNNGFSQGQNAGYHGLFAHGTTSYLSAPASSSPNKSVTWTFNTGTINAGSDKGRQYALYAWIPKSSYKESFVPDATYTISGYGTVQIDQRQGGVWARLGSFLTSSTATSINNLQVKLSNASNYYTGSGNGTASVNWYVAADAMKLVPSELQSFDFSSPAVNAANDMLYIGATGGFAYGLQIGKQEPVWTFPIVGSAQAAQSVGAFQASPALSADGSSLYIGSTTGHVYKLNALTGVNSTGGPIWDYYGTDSTNGGGSNISQWVTLGQITSTTATEVDTSGKVNIVYVAVGPGQDNPPPGVELSGAVFALQDNGNSATPYWNGGNLLGAYPSTAQLATPPGSVMDPNWTSNQDDVDGVGAFIYGSPTLLSWHWYDNSTTLQNGLVVGSTDGYLYGMDAVTGKGFKTGTSTDGTATGRHWLETTSANQSDWNSDYPDAGGVVHSSAAATVIGKGNVTTGETPVAYVTTEQGAVDGFDLQRNPGTTSNAISETDDWSWDLQGPAMASPAIYFGRLYVADEIGYTYAFSDAANGGSSHSGETWNNTISPKPPTRGGSTIGSDQRLPYPEIDIFPASIYNDFVVDSTGKASKAATYWGSGWDGGLHGKSLGNQPWEWGDQVCFIAWNLRNPNTTTGYDSSGNQITVELPPSDPNFTLHQTPDQLTLNISARAPREQSDITYPALTMTDKGYFIVSDTDSPTGQRAVFYARYQYTLGNASRSNPQVPGSRLQVSLRESPVSMAGMTGTVLLPGNTPVSVKNIANPFYTSKPANGKNPTISVPDHNLYRAQRFVINNPLGLSYTDPDYGNIYQIGADKTFGTSRTYYMAGTNGNRRNMPYIRPEMASQGAYPGDGLTSPVRSLYVLNRSLMADTSSSGLTAGLPSLKLRIDRNDLKWVGPNVVNPLPWEISPPNPAYQNLPNFSLDYPDIDSGRVAFAAYQTGIDPSQVPTHLMSASNINSSGTFTTWTAGPTPVNLSINIPKYQPANLPYPVLANGGALPQEQDLEASGYSGRTFAYIDVNNTGHIVRPGATGGGSIMVRRRAGSQADPYREWYTQVHVPVNEKAQIAETTLDIGEVPQGFGLTPANSSSFPSLFYTTLGFGADAVYNPSMVLAPWNGTNGGFLNSFGRWFVPFTATNEGNTNMVDVHLGPAYPSNIYNYMISDDAQDTVYTSAYSSSAYGVLPMSSWLVSTLWGGFVNNYDTAFNPVFSWPSTQASFYTVPYNTLYNPLTNSMSRTFHKARVGDVASPQLRIPDFPGYAVTSYSLSTLDTGYQGKPAVSVAVPIGQPVGSYNGYCQLYDGNPLLNASLRPASNTVKLSLTVTEAQLTDNTSPGTEPHLDTYTGVYNGTGGVIKNFSAGDMAPAAYIDRNTHNMYLYWSSSRIDTTSTNPPGPNDPWRLYESQLSWSGGTSSSAGWVFNNTSQVRWWNPVAPSTALVGDSQTNSLFQYGGSIIGHAWKFSSPNVTVYRPSSTDPTQDKAWLFFTGQGVSNITGKPEAGSQSENRIFFTPIVNGTASVSQIAAVGYVGTASNGGSLSGDWTMPKYGVRGLATDKKLMAFWYGGNNNKWRIYFTGNPTENAGAWTPDTQLALPKGLASAAEPSAAFESIYDPVPANDPTGAGVRNAVVDVIYSGYSNYYKNSDIYLSRYLPAWSAGATSTGLTLTPMYLPPAQSEVLQRDPASPLWYSHDVDWMANTTSAAGTSLTDKYFAGDFGVQVVDTSIVNGTTIPLLNNTTQTFNYNGKSYSGVVVTNDATTGSISYEYTNPSDPRMALFRAVVINPTAGSVRFMRTPGKSAVVSASYFAKAMRLTTDPANDVSPYAFWDTDQNPRYFTDPSGTNHARFYNLTNNASSPPTDRLWVLWRRATLEKPGTGIHYKTFRYMIDLTAAGGAQIGRYGSGTTCPIANMAAANGSPALTGPVEIDWTNNRLYFTSLDAEKTFTISYYGTDGKEVAYTPTATVALTEEAGAGGSSFGNLSRVMINEGQVNAFKDPFENKVWVFWTSARTGNPDIFYEAISPRFYGSEMPN